MIVETLIKIESSSMNRLGKYCMPVWIPYNDGINSTQTISSARNIYATNTPIQQSNGISWTEGRSLLYISKFSKWDADGSPASRNRNVNAIFMFNGTSDDTKKIRLLLQENLKAFHDKAQVWKAKLQTCPEPVNVGYAMYVANTILAYDLISNVLTVVEEENKYNIYIAVQLKAAFQTDSYQKLFYINYSKNDE